MPEVPTVLLLLGNRSPYGLSVARAVLDAFPVRAVVVPTPAAWERVRARTLREGTARPAPLRRTVRWLQRALDRRSPREVPGGQAMPVPDLDPGVTAGELSQRCRARGIAWHEVDEVRSERFLTRARESGAGVLLSAAFPLILPRRLLDLTERGALNFHPSLLPRCRGSHPIYWTLATGEPQGGVSAHVMTVQVDAGDLVAQIAIPLSEEDDYGALYRRAMAASPQLVAEVAAFLRQGGIPRPQDPARASCFREDREQDHEVGWGELTARDVVARTRAGDAFTWLRGRRLGILSARPAEGSARPGRLMEVGSDAFRVAAAAGAVDVTRALWGGRAYGAGSLAEALGLRPGEGLG